MPCEDDSYPVSFDGALDRLATLDVFGYELADGTTDLTTQYRPEEANATGTSLQAGQRGPGQLGQAFNGSAPADRVRRAVARKAVVSSGSAVRPGPRRRAGRCSAAPRQQADDDQLHVVEPRPALYRVTSMYDATV